MARGGPMGTVGALLVVMVAAMLSMGAHAQFTAYSTEVLLARCTLGFGQTTGEVTFWQSVSGGDTFFRGFIAGLKPNALHGWHIHEFGVGPGGCGETGGHFNPFGTPHGAPWDPDDKRHVGDLGNLRTDPWGVAYVNGGDRLVSLLQGARNVTGRALVIHGEEDDLGRGGTPSSLVNGNAGPRIGCCNIVPIDTIAVDEDDDD